MLQTWILVIFMATSLNTDSGTAGVTEEFTSKEHCMQAGTALVKNATDKRYISVLTWGCFPK